MMISRIPIVFIAGGGGNMTGIGFLSVELGPKRLEVFRELVPGLHRVLFPYDPNDASGVAAVRAYRETARRLGIVLVDWKRASSPPWPRDMILWSMTPPSSPVPWPP